MFRKNNNQAEPQQNIINRVFGPVGKLVNIATAHSVTIVQNPLQGVAGLAMVGMVGVFGFSMHMSLKQDHTPPNFQDKINGVDKNQFLIYRLSTTPESRKLTEVEKIKAKQQVALQGYFILYK
jgi:hypothetical protein